MIQNSLNCDFKNVWFQIVLNKMQNNNKKTQAYKVGMTNEPTWWGWGNVLEKSSCSEHV